MTTSIVFDETRNCDGFVVDTTNTGDQESSSILTDPEAPRTALQGLRILKTRETGSIAQVPNTMGRTSGNNINFRAFTYYDLSMRRKAEYLKKQNQTPQTSKNKYAQASKGVSASRNSSQARLKALLESNQCSTSLPIIKKATGAGIKNGKNLLIYNTQIPFFDSL